MHRHIIVFILLLIPALAPAQWLNLVPKNVQGVENALKWTMLRQGGECTALTFRVPTGIISVVGASLPKASVVNASFLYKLKHEPALSAAAVGMRFLVGYRGQAPAGKAFYEEESQLARDLNTFYQGKGVVVRSPINGHRIKLYALPVEGILYKTSALQTPVVLSPQKHFVTYDLEDHSGQIMGNVPQFVRLFDTPGLAPSEEEKVVFDGQTFRIARGDPKP